MKEYHKSGLRWFKGGNDVTFGRTPFLRKRHQQEYYYYLAFEYDFEHPQDEVFFAVSQPYTYSRLVNLIDSTQRYLHPAMYLNHNLRHIEYSKACYSVSNNILPLLRFRHKDNRDSTLPVILFGARQHPCETAGSFIA